MARLCLVLSLSLLLGIALAATPPALAQAAKSKPSAAPATGERLVLPVPKGWKSITDETRQQGQVRVSIKEMVPDGQSAEKWQDRISASSWHGLSRQPLQTSFDMIKSVVDENCEKPAYGKEHEGMERGYPTGLQLIVCAKTKRGNYGEAFIYKTINGKDDLYQIQISWRLPAAQDPDHVALTKQMVDEGTRYLKTVYVCDTRDPQHPCPKGK
ncbi:MAG TPA: hypothetical protein VKY65_21170 [Alphaproteobacteria bacterium]|nr:hypothetical protein [Alphaproteobacteria bacterium]